ncbi:M4 family peptidase [Nocardioides humilatus]|uniref:M4 family peptidase n=1 Tax=Nocardioides humilatus TaxID=2607660 RepID=A0A5B1LF23_9ACTN|nr:M4 family metallopeptidase [Nocardioides humilatus]KAA1418924.1 M4 family peptidase [Nocardioides humilatus]
MIATRSLVASTIVAVAASLTLLPTGPAQAGDPSVPPSPVTSTQASAPRHDGAGALAAAEAVVAGRAHQLYLSRHDRTVPGKVLRSGPLRFVPYERTYRGLPVVGGDFVVVVRKGAVVYTSVAQTGKVRLSDVTARVPASRARATTAGKVRGAQLGRSQLVVLQRGKKSDLAWRTTAVGRRAGEASRLDVYVDARSGRVLKTTEHVLAGTGHANWSGPDPVDVKTLHVGATFSMATPGATTLSCQNIASPGVNLSGADDDWGNGNGLNIETGCVDALYAAQQEKLMLKGWLGRDGMNASNGWLPIRVGLNDQNAFYDGTQVQIGHNTSGEWVGSLDIVGHEFGHGIDDHTPGGLSGSNTSEFVADVFGTATEFFDNQPVAFDEPDFLIGEEVNLSGSGEIRNMINPALEGDPACWSPIVDDTSNSGTEVHAAAGPGDHWFYLAAIGSNAAGMPVSPTCDGAPVTGIGVQKLVKVFYTAMLMKTTASSYKKYRAWTLVAARNLYGQSSCLEFTRIKQAWDAVSVPAEAGEATCAMGQPAVRVTNANVTKVVTAGAAITPFSMTAAGGSGVYNWSASGLPSGLTINASSGQVSGTPASNTPGSYTVAVTATDTMARVGTGWFNITVNPSASNVCSGDRIGNGGYENQTHAPWTMPLWEYVRNLPSVARTGPGSAWMNGAGTTHTELATQQVRLPSGACRATLTFYVWSLTTETSTTTVFDKLDVKVNNFLMLTRTNLDADKCNPNCPAKNYVKVTKVIPAAFLGKTVTLSFFGQEDSSLWTNWHIDDVAVTITPAP